MTRGLLFVIASQILLYVCSKCRLTEQYVPIPYIETLNSEKWDRSDGDSGNLHTLEFRLVSNILFFVSIRTLPESVGTYSYIQYATIVSAHSNRMNTEHSGRAWYD